MTSHDPALPSLHIRPPQGWLNDPNGVVQIDGIYHVFFQYNPDAPEHRAIQWGHMSSPDLIRWRNEPVALRCRVGKLDAYGCWTGAIVDDGGTPTAVYSAVTDSSGHAAVLLARGDRSLISWGQDRHPVMGMPADPTITDVRDPFVFRHNGRRYAIQGAGHRQGRPQILLYGCDDLARWTELGPLLTGDDPVAAQVAPANIWECPNLAQIDGRWVLVLSLWRQVDRVPALVGVRYLVGDLAPAGDGLRFSPRSGGQMDGGPCFYAPQLLVQPGRVLLWAWAWEDGRTLAEVAAAGWAGVLTFPRELSLLGDQLWSRPASELTALRQAILDWRPGVGFVAAAFEIQTEGAVELHLVDQGSESLVIQADASASQPARVLVDGSLIEVFAGPTPTTRRAYPRAGSAWMIRADPALTTAWRLGVG